MVIGGYQTGSRNVSRDLGVLDAREHLRKAGLVFEMDKLMRENRLRQTEVAGLIGIRPSAVSSMLRGEFRQFSVVSLRRFLKALAQTHA